MCVEFILKKNSTESFVFVFFLSFLIPDGMKFVIKNYEPKLFTLNVTTRVRQQIFFFFLIFCVCVCAFFFKLKHNLLIPNMYKTAKHFLFLLFVFLRSFNGHWNK